jgi:ABC-2 type transport system permease protein
MHPLRLYGRYIRINLLSSLQYRGWPLQMLSVFATVAVEPVAVLLLFSRFGAVGGWRAEQVLLVYGLAVTAFGLAEVFSRGYDCFPSLIRTGEFDRVLLRPRSAFVQIIGMRFHLHRLSRVIGGLAIVVWSLLRLGITPGATDLLMLLLALAGGYLVYTGVFVLTSAISFWTVEALGWIYIFTNNSYEVAKCPPSLLPRWLKYTFLYLMPMLVFCYYPASAVCGWGEPAFLGWLALPAGAVFLGIALLVWRVGVRYYKSTGS